MGLRMVYTEAPYSNSKVKWESGVTQCIAIQTVLACIMKAVSVSSMA